MCGSFRWQGDTCVLSQAALSECGPSGEELLSPLVLCSMIYSSHHMSVEVVFGWFTRADMCCVAPHLLVVSHLRGLPHHTCVRRRDRDIVGGKMQIKKYVQVEPHKKIIAEDSLDQVEGKIPYFETIPVFQIVKLTFSAAVASERG